MNFYRGSSSFWHYMKQAGVKEISFNAFGTDFIINDEYMNSRPVTNSRGTLFHASLYGIDERGYYLCITRVSPTRRDVAIVVSKDMQVIEIMRWEEMRAKYFPQYFRTTQTNDHKIAILKAKQAELQAEIDRLQAEIDKLS